MNIRNENKSIYFSKSRFDTLCTKCNKYLSVGPVKTLSGKPVCGRCQEAKAVPADFYEKLAQHMYFPCTNDRYGCKATLAWGSVLAHEKKCKFSPAVCPALNCSQKIQKEKIIEHFESNHEKLMLAAKNNFILPCSYEDQNAPVNKILTWKKQVFVLKMNFSSTCCFLGILSWESSDTKKLLYNLSIEDDKKRQNMHIRDVSIVEYQMKHHNNSAMTKLDVAAMKSALNADTLLCTVSIGQKSSKEYSPNESLLTELECPICMEYMKPPIWMCSMGHSICNSCKPNVMKCPTCQVGLKRNRNFALEKS
ncbi:hypothetical protein JTB14_032241 [Gonioctena quinquepunctata]|nr:hypothetical protein JTB14_032241 [Gonioctena quinquepunctata]